MSLNAPSLIRQTQADNSRITCPRRMLSLLNSTLAAAGIPANQAYQLALPHAQHMAAQRPGPRPCAACRAQA